MSEPSSEGRFSLKRIAMVLAALALTWLAIEFIDIPLWALTTFVVVGGVVIIAVALLILTSQDLHLEGEKLVWSRPGKPKPGLTVADIIMIEDPADHTAKGGAASHPRARRR